MDNEYYSSHEYKKIDEYKKMPAEDYRARREYFSPKRELKRDYEENNHNIRPKEIEHKRASTASDDQSNIKRLLDKITTTTTTAVTSTAVAVAGVSAVVVAPEILPDLPPVIPPTIPIIDLSLSTIEIADNIESFAYTGEEIRPQVRVIAGGEEIDSSLYNIEYSNNIMPGLASIKITSNDKSLAGEVERSFVIAKCDNEITIKYENGEIIIDSSYGSPILKYYSDSECLNEIERPTLPGNYYARASLAADDTHNMAVSNILAYIIPTINIEKAKIDLINKDLIYYSGNEIKPEFNVLLNDELIDLSNFDIKYSNNINPGKGKITITGNNKIYSGSLEYEFSILKRLNSCSIKYVGNEMIIDATYGNPILRYYKDSSCLNEIERPKAFGHYFVKAFVAEGDSYLSCESNVCEYNIILDLKKTRINIINKKEYYYNGSEIRPEIELLLNSEVIDPALYKIEYKDNLTPGRATIRVLPNGDSTIGECNISFTILKALNECIISYNGSDIVINSTYGNGVLRYYKDSSCLNEIEKPVAHGHYFVRAEVRVTDNYNGALSNILEYNIPLDLSGTTINIINKKEYYYDGSEIRPEIEVLLNKERIDSTLYRVEYLNNKLPGEATIRIAPVNNDSISECSITFRILKALNECSISYSGSEIIISSGYGNGVLKYYSDSECLHEIAKPTKHGHYFIRAVVAEGDVYTEALSNILEYNIPLDLSGAVISIKSPVEHRYTGSELKPEIEVRVDGELIDPTLYNVEYSANINPGNASIKITPASSESIGEATSGFIILKGENQVLLEYKNNDFIATPNHGSAVIRYYSDPECNTEIARPSGYGSYYVRALVFEDDYYLGALSEILEYVIPLDLAKLDISLEGGFTFVETGSEIRPRVMASTNGLEVNNNLFEIQYLNNISPGKATVKLVPKDNRAVGECSVNFIINYKSPTIVDEGLRAGNDFIEINYNLTNSQGIVYHLDILHNGVVEATYDLKTGDNYHLFKNLMMSTKYDIVIYSNEANGRQEYLTNSITTLDGSKVTFSYDLKPYLKSQYETGVEFNIYISDPKKLYSSYTLQFSDSISTYDRFETTTNTFSGKTRDCMVGDLTLDITIYDEVNYQEVTLDSYQYTLNSIATAPNTFPKRYEIPNINQFTYKYTDTEIIVNPHINVIDQFDPAFEMVRIYLADDTGMEYQADITGSDDTISITNLNAKWITFRYAEIIYIDGLEHELKRESFADRLSLEMSVTPSLIMVDKASDNLSMEFNLNLKPGYSAKLKNESAMTVDVINGRLDYKLPNALTSYSYQIYDSSDVAVGEAKSFSVDPNKYTAQAPEVFNPVDGNDVVKTYQNGNNNFYIYTGFKSASPNGCWYVRLKSLEGEFIYRSQTELVEALGLFGEYELEYYVGEEYDGVLYTSSIRKMINDTSTNDSDFKSSSTITSDATSTTVRLEFSDIDRIYDFDNSKLYIGLASDYPDYTGAGEPNLFTLMNSDFTHDEVKHIWYYEKAVPIVTNSYDFIFMANKNAKNIDLIKKLTTIRGDLYREIEFAYI